MGEVKDLLDELTIEQMESRLGFSGDFKAEYLSDSPTGLNMKLSEVGLYRSEYDGLIHDSETHEIVESPFND